MISQTNQPKIQLLPEHIIDQVKAGEVIERPGTLVKELLENSIDAKASKIAITIHTNGMDLISVEDNGTGIPHSDLPLAFARHATSKITRFEDLYALFTYGFRGEALASIASVSKLSCRSAQKDVPASNLKIEGGQVLSHTLENSPAMESGTAIFVKDLFYNTPARLKFIQSQSSEKNFIKKIIHSFLLTHPEVSFSIQWDNSAKKIYPATDNLSERIKKIFFNQTNPIRLYEGYQDYDSVKCRLFLSDFYSKGNAGKHQYLFINGRFVQDVQLHKIILNSATALWPIGHSGHYFCFLDLPSDQIDANVHPNKLVVKFHRPAIIHSIVSNVARNEIIAKIERPNLETSPPVETDFLNPTSIPAQSKGLNYSSSSLGSLDHMTTPLEKFQQRQQTPVSEKFFIGHYLVLSLFEKNEPWLIDAKCWILTEFKHALLNTSAQNIPLLISAPLRNITPSSRPLILHLSQLGFEIESPGQEMSLIKSFPQGMEHLPFAAIIQELLLTRESTLKDSITSLINNENFLNINWEEFATSKRIATLSAEYITNNKIGKKLTASLLSRLLS